MKESLSANRPTRLQDGIARSRSWYRRMELGDQTKSLLCIVGLALLPFFVFWEVATFQRIPFAGDILDYYYPVQYLINQQIEQGHIPLWFSQLFSGTPLMAVTGALYPLNLPFVPLPTWVGMTYSLLAHFSLAGIFAYLYARELGLGRKGAVATGITFMFCGFSMAHLGHHNIIRTVPWLPLVLWALERWRKRFELRYIGLGALAVGLMFLGGHPQIPVYSSGVIFAYILFLILFPGEPRRRWRIAVGAAAMAVIGLLIASPLIWDLYQMSHSFASPVAAGSYDYTTQFSLEPLYLLHMIFPLLFQKEMAVVEMAGYIGILPLALAVLAIFHWKHRVRGFLLFIACVSLLLTLGKFTPLYQLMHRVPVYNAFQAPARNWFEFDFALAVLAGAGFDRLISARETGVRRLSHWSRGLGTGLVFLAGLVVFAAIWPLPEQAEQILLRNNVTTLGDRAAWLPMLMIVSSSVVLFILASRSDRWYSVALVTALIVADLYFSFAITIVTAHSARQPPAQIFADASHQQPDSVQFLKKDRSLYRILSYSPNIKPALDEKYSLVTPNLNLLFNLDSADAYNGTRIPAQYRAFTDNSVWGLPGGWLQPRLLAPDHNTILSLLNVKYVLVPVKPDVLAWGFIMVDGIALNTFPEVTLQLGEPSALISATLDLPAYPATTLAIASSLVGGTGVIDGEQVARVTVTDANGKALTYYLTAGQDTSDLTYDCTPTAMNHAKAPVAYDVPTSLGCSFNVYFARLEIGTQPITLRQVKLEYLLETGLLNVEKLSLYNAQTGTSHPASTAQGYHLAYLSQGDSYQPVYEDDYVRVYENTRVLPRAFLVPHVEFVNGAEEADRIVLQGILPDGRSFSPKEVALVEAPLVGSPAAESAITLYAYPTKPELWTVVQWQDTQGGWHDVEGWQAPFDDENQVTWWVAPEDLGKGPFRWAIHESQGGPLVAATDPFYLPASVDEQVRVQVPLLWPSSAQNSAQENRGEQADATVISARAGHMEIQTASDHSVFLVYSENFFPGWKASLDGQPASVYRTNGTLLGVPVPAGKHLIVLTYRPPTLYLALLSGFITLSIIIGLVSIAVRAVRQKSMRP